MKKKKKFTSGLASVFEEKSQIEPNIGKSPWMSRTSNAGEIDELQKSKRKRKNAGSKEDIAKAVRKHSSRKNFSSDLDSLFEKTVEVAQKNELKIKAIKDVNRPSKKVSIYSGLDSLIRDTRGGIDTRHRTSEDIGANKKRMTFTYDSERINKLKTIAKDEGVYVRDVISKALTQYLNKYEQEHEKE